MSGICGVVAWHGTPLPPGTLQRMAHAAAHRAPDGLHTWTSPHAQLAHLAHHTTPEDAEEHQPLTHHHLTLISDARLDNRHDLIPTLRAHLHSDPPSDAELILAAHLHWGDDSPAHLIGDYAYALWNDTTRTLFAARDPMGMRALYYHASPHHLTFATELKQLLTTPHVPIELDETMAMNFLLGRFESLDSTHYAGIAQLPPGHALQADPGGLRTWRTWEVDPEHRIRYQDERDYAAHFLELFKDAVHARSRSSKPLGILLSGGMDSGSIAATLGWLDEHQRPTPPVHTYSWAFDTLPQCDERHVSDLNARRYGFTTTPISVDDHAPLTRYPDYGPDRDEPMVGVYQALIEGTLARARDDGVGVMFSGDRGDLMVGAWILRYPRLLRSRRWRELRHELREHVDLPGASMAGVLFGYLARPLAETLLRNIGSWSAMKSWISARADGNAQVPPWVKEEHLRRVGAEGSGSLGGSVASAALSGYTRRVRHDLVFSPMHARGMVWSERTYARFGQAFADPWSDRRLASFVLAIPQQVLDRPGRLDKRLVREAMRGVMPEEVRRATSKVVPNPLFERALRHDSVDTVLSLISGSQAAARGFVDERALQDHFAAIRRGEPPHAAFWWALALEMWLRRYWT